MGIRTMLSCFGTNPPPSSTSHWDYEQLPDEKTSLFLSSSDDDPFYHDDIDNDPPTYSYNTRDAHMTYGPPPLPPSYSTINPSTPSTQSIESLAATVTELLRTAPWNDDTLQSSITMAVGPTTPWTRRLVEEILDSIIDIVERGRSHMGPAMTDALDRATDLADDHFTFPRRHPESVDGFIAIVAVGILAQMQGAWVLELLGFGEVPGKEEGGEEETEGGEIAMLSSDRIVMGDRPRGGSVASWWSREYGAYIPRGSVRDFLGELDMLVEEGEEGNRVVFGVGE